MDSFKEQASQAIHQSGGRMTPQRWLLIGLLETAENYLDAESLYEQALTHDTSISLTTVYRTLNTLEQAGILKPRYLSQAHERKYYEPLHMEIEYHFTCRVCKRLIPFRSPLLQQLQNELEAEMGLAISHACVCFSGLCPDCQQKEK